MNEAMTFDGVVLAGGRSTRMGSDKAALPWRGQSLLQHMQQLLQHAGARRVMLSGPYQGPLGLPDLQPGLGPLGSVMTLAYSQPDGIYLLVPVDMPRLSAALLRRLVAETARGAHAVMVAGYALPLCLRLDADARASIGRIGAQSSRLRSLRALHAALEGLEMALTAGDESCLVNCNTPEEWQRVSA
jgi:molybdopterin-guanine dinucleotide biosynthesis protein A